MKVLIVTNMYPDPTRPYNGIFIAEQIAAIRKCHSGVDFDVCYIDGGKGKQEYLKSIFYVNRKIRRGGYDLVHVHFGLSGMYMLMPFRAKVPTIVTFHGSDIQPAARSGCLTVDISRYVASRADVCVTLNGYMDSLVRQLNKNTFIVPCAVDTDIFKPTCERSFSQRKRIIFPCNHGMEVKNYPLFCRVLERLESQYDIDCEEVEMAGLSRERVAHVMNGADLLLMTSFSEGSPQSVKEAMACNLPVVSTPVGDVANLLRGVKDCYVASAHDADELARLAAASLSGSGDGITGREKIREMQLDEKSVADRIFHIYEQSVY